MSNADGSNADERPENKMDLVSRYVESVKQAVEPGFTDVTEGDVYSSDGITHVNVNMTARS